MYNRPGGNNPGGRKWNRGGAGRRKNYISIDFDIFAEYAERLDMLGGDLKKIFTDAMEQAAETVQDDTGDAITSSNLPAGGKYSRGATEESLLRGQTVQWSGSVGEIGLGFDKSVPGSGGWLITGTPKMRPDYELQKIYGQKLYERKLMKDIQELLQDEIDAIMGG